MTTQSRVPLWAGLVCAALTLGVLAQARAPAVAAANWRIDPARTHIAFAIDAVGYPRTHGQFRQFAGRISVDFEHPERSSVSFQVQSQSVDVGSASFDDYLRSDAFLNSTRFPSIDFVSSSVAKVDDHTVRAQSISETSPAKPPGEGVTATGASRYNEIRALNTSGQKDLWL